MKKLFTLAAFAVMSNVYAQNLDYPRLGIGFQASFPAFGISAKADITEQHSAQAIIGVAGPFSAYYGKYMYNFPENGDSIVFRPYLYGQAGLYTYQYPTFDISNNVFSMSEQTEKVFGYGLGGGLEFHFPNLTDRLRWNFEVGYGNVGFEYYKFKSTVFGAGIHYHFNL